MTFEKMRINKHVYQPLIKKIEIESGVNRKLIKLFELNKTHINKINDNLIKIVADPKLIMSVYCKLKTNKRFMTKDIANGTNIETIKIISKQIKSGTFKWTDICRKEIKKPRGGKIKRPLENLNFNDKIVQELIRIVLNVLYEPVFQAFEYNHGFRPKRSPQSAIRKLQIESQNMSTALEGCVKKAFDTVDFDILMDLLKKKINDTKFLKLIKDGLKNNIRFEKKKEPNLRGITRIGAVSTILFNIYMHQFDLVIYQTIKNLAEKNLKESRNYYQQTKKYATITSRIHKVQKKIKALLKQKNDTREFNFKKFMELRNFMKMDKKKLCRTPVKDESRRVLRIAYSRYADDWIIITNLKSDVVENIKSGLTIWLKEKLRLELDSEKTVITNLKKNKAKYLGFTISELVQKVGAKKIPDGRIAVPLHIGINHDRLKTRLINSQIINSKYHTRHVGLDCSLKPWHIVEKFKQRIEGIIHYYYKTITSPSDLNFYYYVHKFSCLKTLAHRMRKSIRQVNFTYGNRLVIKMQMNSIDSEGRVKKIEKISYFPTYLEIMDQVGEKVALENKELYKKLKLKKDAFVGILNPVEFEDIVRCPHIFEDSLSAKHM